MPIHLHARPGDVAPVVLLPGDPGRAERIAARLEDAVCYTRNRGLLGFTGRYHGTRLSVQTTGMGAPSTAIVAEELVQLGAHTLIRTGTAGAITDRVAPGNLIVATASTPLDGTTAAYLGGAPAAPVASYHVTRSLVEAVTALGLACHTGLIVTDDVFYHPDADRLAHWARFGALAVEMEASALFTVAARHGLEAGCVLTVSNSVGASAEEWPDPPILLRAIDAMINVALAAAAALSPGRPALP